MLLWLITKLKISSGHAGLLFMQNNQPHIVMAAKA